MPVITGRTREQVDAEVLEAKRAEALAAAERWLSDTLAAGFEFGGHTWQADDRAQSIALGTIVMAQSDQTVFPREWRNKANDMILFPTLAEFGPFVGAMKNFVDQTYAAVFARKGAIRSAITLQELEEVQA